MLSSLTDCICTHIDSFRQGLCDALGTPVSKKFRGRKCVRFIFTHSSPAQKKIDWEENRRGGVKA